MHLSGDTRAARTYAFDCAIMSGRRVREPEGHLQTMTSSVPALKHVEGKTLAVLQLDANIGLNVLFYGNLTSSS